MDYKQYTQQNKVEKQMECMYLKIFAENKELAEKYKELANNHNNKCFNPENKYPDSGFDLIVPETTQYTIENKHNKHRHHTFMVDYKIKCSSYMFNLFDSHNIIGTYFNLSDTPIFKPTLPDDTHESYYPSGYYLYPRSSLSKTNFRFANSVGIIDSGYRGNLMAAFDYIGDMQEETDMFCVEEDKKYVQICSPILCPIYVDVVDTIEELGEKTQRGNGGFGSTGK